MRFGPAPLDQALGSILAHGVRLPGGAVLRKGRVLTGEDVEALRDAGVGRPVVARLEADDVPEDEAARKVASALAGEHVEVGEPAAGRCNLVAARDGVACVSAAHIDALNAVDERVQTATLAPLTPVRAGGLAATVKVVPFAVPEAVVARCVERVAGRDAGVSVAPYRRRDVGLILTRLSGTPQRALDLARRRIADRVRRFGGSAQVRVVEHAPEVLAASLSEGVHDLILVYGASATSDRADVVPSAVLAAGGDIERFGMPVDPGNLLLLARLGSTPVVGVPGCARSPQESGFDRVLARLMADVPVGGDDLAAMGVGGLLKEIATRPAPREGRRSLAGTGVRVHAGTSAVPGDGALPGPGAVVLAAGMSRRMGSRNKLLEEVEGEVLVHRVVRTVASTGFHPVVVVTGHEAERVAAAVDDLPVERVDNPRFAEGMATSLAAGLSALGDETPGVMVCLGDMPWVTAGHLRALAGAFDPSAGRSICVPTHRGKRGNPVLWDARFIPDMRALEGDRGARNLLSEYADEVWEVEMEDDGVLRDIDTAAALDALGLRPSEEP